MNHSSKWFVNGGLLWHSVINQFVDDQSTYSLRDESMMLSFLFKQDSRHLKREIFFTHTQEISHRPKSYIFTSFIHVCKLSISILQIYKFVISWMRGDHVHCEWFSFGISCVKCSMCGNITSAAQQSEWYQKPVLLRAASCALKDSVLAQPPACSFQHLFDNKNSCTIKARCVFRSIGCVECTSYSPAWYEHFNLVTINLLSTAATLSKIRFWYQPHAAA